MRRRSRAGGKSPNAQAPKTAARKSRIAPKAVRPHPDPAAPQDALRLVLETALDAVVVMKSDGVVAEWNDRAAGVFGWSRDEAVGRTMADLIMTSRDFRFWTHLRHWQASRPNRALGREL